MPGQFTLSARAVVEAVDLCSPPLAAYQQGGDPEVWRSCPTDSPGDMTQITSFSGYTEVDACANPTLSPDGTLILFEGLDAATAYDGIWIVDNVAGSTATQLVVDADDYVRYPNWAADSDTFIYTHFAGSALNNGKIYKDTVSSPGSPTLLKSDTGFSMIRPQFNYDGTRIAYLRIPDSGPTAKELRVMDADGSNDSLLDNTISGYTANDPPQFGWANTSNMIAYTDGATSGRNTYLINDDGTGKTQLDASGAAAGLQSYVSGTPFAPDDSFAIITAGSGVTIFRAELDGSNTTVLGTDGPPNQAQFRSGIAVYNNRIWFVSQTSSFGGKAQLSSMAIDGTDEQVNFDNSLGPGNLVQDFANGDGFYFN